MCSNPKIAVSVLKYSTHREGSLYFLEKEKEGEGRHGNDGRKDGPGLPVWLLKHQCSTCWSRGRWVVQTLPGPGLSSLQCPSPGPLLCSCSLHFLPFVPSSIPNFLPQDSCMWGSWILSPGISLAELLPTLSSYHWPWAPQWSPSCCATVSCENLGPKVSVTSSSREWRERSLPQEAGGTGSPVCTLRDL